MLNKLPFPTRIENVAKIIVIVIIFMNKSRIWLEMTLKFRLKWIVILISMEKSLPWFALSLIGARWVLSAWVNSKYFAACLVTTVVSYARLNTF